METQRGCSENNVILAVNKRARSSFMKHALCNAQTVWPTSYAWHGREVSVIMGPFECSLVLRPSLASVPEGALFWPAGRSRLALLFESLTDKIIVRGIDPDATEQFVLVFRAELLPDQKDRFVQAVSDGLEPTLISPPTVSNENRTPGVLAPAARKPASSLAADEIHNDAIVIIDRPGDGPGPRYTLELPSLGAARATGTQG